MSFERRQFYWLWTKTTMLNRNPGWFHFYVVYGLPVVGEIHVLETDLQIVCLAHQHNPLRHIVTRQE